MVNILSITTKQGKEYYSIPKNSFDVFAKPLQEITIKKEGSFYIVQDGIKIHENAIKKIEYAL